MDNKNQTYQTPITVADATINPVKEEKDDRPLIQVNKQKLNLLVKKLPKYAMYAGVAIAGGLLVGALTHGSSDDEENETKAVLLGEDTDSVISITTKDNHVTDVTDVKAESLPSSTDDDTNQD